GRQRVGGYYGPDGGKADLESFRERKEAVRKVNLQRRQKGADDEQIPGSCPYCRKIRSAGNRRRGVSMDIAPCPLSVLGGKYPPHQCRGPLQWIFPNLFFLFRDQDKQSLQSLFGHIGV